MKSKYIKSLFFAAILLCSISSFVYLNYNASSQEIPITQQDVEAKAIDEEDSDVLSELTVMKHLGKKLFEVLTFSVS